VIRIDELHEGMPASGLDGVVFDLDGTLVNTASDIARAVNALLEERDEEPCEVKYVERFLGGGARELVAGVYAGLGVAVTPERLDVDTARYLKHYSLSPAEQSTVYQDGLSTLDGLQTAGVRVGVCTNKGQDLAEVVLSQLGLRRYVDVVVGGDALSVRKPDPRHLLTTLQRMGVSAERSLFVGDSNVDVETAHRAGVPCMVVAWAKGEFKGANQPPRLHRFADLLSLVQAQGHHSALQVDNDTST